MTARPTPQSPVEALASYVHAILFETLDPAEVQRIAGDLAWVHLSPGGVLFRQDAPSDAMYVVVEGQLQVRIAAADGADLVVGTIGAGEPVGEIQIVSGGRRTATVSAVGNADLIAIPKAAVDRLVETTPDAMQGLANLIRRRLRRNQLAAVLSTLLGHLDGPTLADVESALTWVMLPRGETLFQQGEDDSSIYILIRGRLRAVVRSPAGVDKVVGDVRRGETVGEMALFAGRPRTATVHAVRDSELVRLEKPAFEQLMAKYPAVMLHLVRLTIERLDRAQAGTAPGTGVSSIAIVPATSAGAAAVDFGRRLTAALSRWGPTLHLNAAHVDELLGTPGVAQAVEGHPDEIRVATWLDEQEVRHRFMLLDVDPTPSAWTRRCLRQAEQVLIVGEAAADPTPGELERTLLDPHRALTSAQQVLVLLHPDGSRAPAGTARWLQPRHVRAHHHVRLDRNGDVERVARLLAGRAVGLALGGGGARGFAHIGIFQALDEAGIPIDMIGGTSMGALMAAEHALGWDRERMIAQNQQLFGRWATDITLPIVAILGGHRSLTKVRRCVGDVRIEDMWLPYFCVSSSLTRGEPVVHRSGLLRTGLRASATLPGILPPVTHEGELLVDGGFLCNLPANVMSDLCEGSAVIAVDVSAAVDLQDSAAYGEAISGWRILWSRMNPFGARILVPNAATILQRAAQLASNAMQRSTARACELYVRMPVEQFGLLEFASARRIIDAGYQHATRVIAEWRRRLSEEDAAAVGPALRALQIVLDGAEGAPSREGSSPAVALERPLPLHPDS